MTTHASAMPMRMEMEPSGRTLRAGSENVVLTGRR